MEPIKITITHVIDPNRFYFRTSEEELKQIEKKMLGFLKTQPQLADQLKIGDRVAFSSCNNGKMIRCDLDDIHEETTFIMWAVDYGCPLYTRKSTNIYALPEELASVSSTICEGGLTIMPADLRINFENSRQEVVELDEQYTEQALTIFKKYINAGDVLLMPSDIIRDDEIVFGELQCSNGLKLSEKMVQENVAVKVEGENFLKYFNLSLSACLDRWQNYKGHIEVLEIPDGTLLMESYPSKLSLLEKKNRDMVNVLETVQLEILKSCEKVEKWKEQNEGIEPENEPINLNEFDEKSIRSSDVNSKQEQMTETKPAKSLKMIFSNYFRKKMLPNTNSFKRDPVKYADSPLMFIPAGAIIPNKKFKQSDALKEVHCCSIPDEYNDEASYPGLDKLLMQKPANSQIGFMPVHLRTSEKQKLDDSLSIVEANIPKIQEEISTVQKTAAKDSKWMTLEMKSYHVSVCSFDSVSSFFVQVISDEDRWDDMWDTLSKLKELEPLDEIHKGQLCLVECDDGAINRAIIIRCSEIAVICFCVDTAEITFFRNGEEMGRIFKMSEEIEEIMPFQTVNCRLACITASSMFSLTSIIYHKFIRRILKQSVKVLRELDGNNPELSGLQGIKSYDVILFDEQVENGPTVNELLVKYQLADLIKNV